MKKEPIFIVGAPRSGTTLMAAMLAAHSRLSCGPETHFFRWLSRTDVRRLCERETWPEAAAEFVWSIDHTAFPPGARKKLIDKYQISRETISDYLKTQEPAVSSIVCSVTEPYMRARGKERWLEKTPDHILHTRLIRKYFPGSPIIRMMRDPRDVALSLMKVPWGVKTLLEGLLYWERLDGASRDFFSTDKLCHTVRFEDLVASTTEELRKVCRFIDEEFENRMLDTSATGKEVNSRNAPWKDKASQAVDVSRMEVWRGELTRRENQLAEAVLGDRMEAYGYSRKEEFPRVGEVCPKLNFTAKYAGALGALAAGGMRFWKVSADEKPTAKIYLGDPGHKSGEKPANRFASVLPVLTDIARSSITRNHLYWVPDTDDGEWSGCFSFLLKKVLSPYKISPGEGATSVGDA